MVPTATGSTPSVAHGGFGVQDLPFGLENVDLGNAVLTPSVITFWRPAPEEIEALRTGALVKLTVSNAQSIAPTKIEVVVGEVEV